MIDYFNSSDINYNLYKKNFKKILNDEKIKKGGNAPFTYKDVIEFLTSNDLDFDIIITDVKYFNDIVAQYDLKVEKKEKHVNNNTKKFLEADISNENEVSKILKYIYLLGEERINNSLRNKTFYNISYNGKKLDLIDFKNCNDFYNDILRNKYNLFNPKFYNDIFDYRYQENNFYKYILKIFNYYLNIIICILLNKIYKFIDKRNSSIPSNLLHKISIVITQEKINSLNIKCNQFSKYNQCESNTNIRSENKVYNKIIRFILKKYMTESVDINTIFEYLRSKYIFDLNSYNKNNNNKSSSRSIFYFFKEILLGSDCFKLFKLSNA